MGQLRFLTFPTLLLASKVLTSSESCPSIKFIVIVNFVKLNGHYQNRKIKEIGGNRVLYNDSQMVRLYQK